MWQPLIKGFNDDSKAACIGAQQCAKVCHQLDGQEIIGVGDFKCFHKGGQTVVAEPGTPLLTQPFVREISGYSKTEGDYEQILVACM